MDKLEKNYKRIFIFISILVSIFFIKNVSAANVPVITFTDSGIVETSVGSGYKITGTTLTIKSSGTYRIKSSLNDPNVPAEGNIIVDKGVNNVTLILDNLSIKSSTTAPIVIGKDGANVVIKTVGTSRLFDEEDPSNEFSPVSEIRDLYEGSAIKVKNGSSLTLSGTGKLEIISHTNNAIKGGEQSSITINSGTYNINSVNNGIACDGPIVINGGNINIDAFNEGIKISPDENESIVNANLTINGGKVSIDAGEDGISTLGNIYINNGSLTINSLEDGIQTRSNFYMTNGVLNITTYEGYNTDSFNKDVMSAKGIKASASDDEVDDSSCLIQITGGTVTINSSDDAIHSDGTVKLERGTFNLSSHDDGVHADTVLQVGTENGFERDPEINVSHSYEGLEAGNVYIYSGKIKIKASDDGINAAGGSSNDPDGDDSHFNPGELENFALYIYGGNVYVDVEGDALDSNGSIYLYGGNIILYPESTTDGNSALDRDGDLVIDGATVAFAGGHAQSGLIHDIGSNQKYVLDSTNYYHQGENIAVYDSNGNLIFNDELLEDSNYTFYTSPSLENGAYFDVVSTLDLDKANPWIHPFDQGVVTSPATPSTPGVITYTCTIDGNIERKTYFYTGELEFNIFNSTNHVANVSFGGTLSDENFTVNSSNGELIVTSDKKFIVLVKNIGEEDYTKLTATDVTNNTYSFNIDVDTSKDIHVILEGDINQDGIVNNLDSELIKKSKLSINNVDRVVFTPIQELIADLNANGIVNVVDALIINKNTLSSLDTITNKLKLTNSGSVELDGENDGYVDVFLTASANINIDALEAYFFPNNEDTSLNQYFTLQGIERLVDQSDDIVDSENGLAYYINSNGLAINKNDNIYKATFKVNKDTPTGAFHISSRISSIVEHNSTAENSLVLNDQIIVKSINTPYTAVFEGDEGVTSFDVFYTKDDKVPNESGVTYTVSRDESGNPTNISEGGQINFRINLQDGYVIKSITIEPTNSYKNLKGPSDTGMANTYRITKIKGDMTVTVETKVATEYTAEFIKGTGIKKVDVFYTQDYTTPDETDVNEAYARNGDTGDIDLSGDGQVNFKVTPKNGYKLGPNPVSIQGNYKNIKDQGDGIYRITKISGDLLITLNAVQRKEVTPIISGIQESYVYSGSQITPEVNITVEVPDEINPSEMVTIPLVLNKDYTVIYGDNTHIGNGTVTIKSVSTSDYMFNDIVEQFTISPYELTLSNVIAPSSVVYTGETLSPNIEVKVNNYTLVKDTDYEVVYTNLNGNIGENITAVVTGINNYVGVIDNINILISDKYAQEISFNETDVETTYGQNVSFIANHPVGDGNIVYSSSDETIASVNEHGYVTVHKAGNVVISATASETVEYESATDSYNLVIHKAHLTIDNVSISDKNYDGNTDAEVIKTHLSGVTTFDTLLKGTDYIVTGTFDNKNIGYDKNVTVNVNLNPDVAEKYEVVNNGYLGKASITLIEIPSSSITLDNSSYNYDGKFKTPTVSIIVNGNSLVKDTDYTVEYKDNKDAGTAKVIINGIGNYVTDGELVKNFTINKKVILPTIDSISDAEYTGSGVLPIIVLKNGSETLTQNVDYIMEASNNVELGTANLVIKPKSGSNMTFSEINTTFNVVPYNIKEEDIGLSYKIIKNDGTAKEPIVTLVVGGNTLTQGVDYSVEYSNNVNPTSEAQVIVTGLTEKVTGTKTVYFEITSKNILEITGISDNQEIVYTGEKVILDGDITIKNNPDNIKVSDLDVRYYNSLDDSEISKPVNVGSYYAIYRYNDDTNKGELKVNFSIIKKESSLSSKVTENISGMKNEPISTLGTIVDGLTFDNDSTLIKAGKNNYKASYVENNDPINHTIVDLEVPIYGKSKVNINTSVVGKGGNISGSLTDLVEGTQKTVSLLPEKGYEVYKLIINGVETPYDKNELIVTAGPGDINIAVKFKEETSGVNVNTETNATVDTDVNTNNKNDNNTKEITITPDDGYKLKSVKVNGKEAISKVSKDNKLTIEDTVKTPTIDVVAVKDDYKITKGDNQVYNPNNGKDLKISINANYSAFKNGGKIYVDDIEVDSKYYSVTEGLDIVLSKEYLNKLDEGKHELKIKFNDESTAKSTFTIKRNKIITNRVNGFVIAGVIALVIVIITIIIYLINKNDDKEKEILN